MPDDKIENNGVNNASGSDNFTGDITADTTGGSTGNLISVDIEKEVKKSYLEYSMSVIIGRALPDVRDGLKPVHRRILYTMYEKGLKPEKPYRKCADTVGAVLGSYHPHGDAAVYDSMVRMAQSFSLRYPLIDGHGNFGSIDGDPAAAYRYTESRMSKISTHMLDDIEKETVQFSPNYDDRLKEPDVLPSRFPSLLVNGSSGIAVGMATNIPPHNLGETIDATCCLIDNPDADMDELMQHIKGPDFPTGGVIMGYSGIRAAYATGRGKITLRARAEIEEDAKGRSSIVVTEIPYQVNKAKMVEQIANLVKDKRIEGISAVEDYSGKDGLRVVVELKRDANAQVVLNKLYMYSQMQITFGVIMLALCKGVPKVMNLKKILTEYINFQKEVVTRRTIYDLKKAEERAHLLKGCIIALDNIDEVIDILRNSKNVQEGKTHLIERFNLDDVQATYIVQMKLGQLTGLERQKIEDEMADLIKKIADFKDILANEDHKSRIVKEELLQIKTQFSDERRTEIKPVSGEVDIEDLISQEDCVLTLTNFGYIKRIAATTYKSQNRGGRGISALSKRDEDVVKEMFICSTHDYVLFFTNKGRMYRIKCFEVPEASRTSKGMNIANILPLQPDETVTSMLKVNEYKENAYLVMVTKSGLIKRIELDVFKNVRKSGIIAIDLNEGDELSWVKLTDGDSQLVVGTRKGMAIRFNEQDVRAMGRLARGVRSIRLVDGDEVVGMDVVTPDCKILTVTETGYGRISNESDYGIQTRGGKGKINYRTSKYGDVAAIRVINQDDDLIIISADGVIIRIKLSDISIYSRPAKGVRVMRILDDNRIVSIAEAPHEEDEETSSVEDDGSGAEGEGLTPEDEQSEKTEEPDDSDIEKDTPYVDEGIEKLLEKAQQDMNDDKE